MVTDYQLFLQEYAVLEIQQPNNKMVCDRCNSQSNKLYTTDLGFLCKPCLIVAARIFSYRSVAVYDINIFVIKEVSILLNSNYAHNFNMGVIYSAIDDIIRVFIKVLPDSLSYINRDIIYKKVKAEFQHRIAVNKRAIQW